LNVLERSRLKIPHPTDWDSVYYPLPEMAGVKSWSTFMKGSRLLTLEVDVSVLVVTPTKNLGPEEGHVPLDDKVIRIDYGGSAEAIGTAIQNGIAFCE
jgi:hypothetical protein